MATNDDFTNNFQDDRAMPSSQSDDSDEPDLMNPDSYQDPSEMNRMQKDMSESDADDPDRMSE